jgi:hypothetical protein
VDGTGKIVRMKSSYSLRNITKRNTYSNGNTVKNGPDVSTTYPLGYFREDYQYNPTSSSTPDYLDEHNGRFCITPEYPKGIYCYYATVDSNWNSAYPYAVGPTFYGVKNASKVTSISESVTTYTPTSSISNTDLEDVNINIYPNPANDIIAIQWNDINTENKRVELFDALGKLVQSTILLQGSTITHFDTRTLYNGMYEVKISDNKSSITKKVMIMR